ncbi:MAG TPA: hypothetical protein VNV42_09170 [Solirubrobacteraceae bacterium]|nr:hypothetical protein [Solirubrobacteraceae bacterium]
MLSLIIALGASVAVVAPAWAREPTGPFSIFKECPRFTPRVNYCLFGNAVNGEFRFGTQKVVLTHQFTVQLGLDEDEETEAESVVGPLNGEVLQRVRQEVPGGLLGSPLYATVELAGPPRAIGVSRSNLINEEGVALSLPIRIDLENPMLGNECFIGSDATPVTVKLTTGRASPVPPNGPIQGKMGQFRFEAENSILDLLGNRLVDNAFPAPQATGCGGSLMAALVDARIGLPSPDGHNTAILYLSARNASTSAVIKSER